MSLKSGKKGKVSKNPKKLPSRQTIILFFIGLVMLLTFATYHIYHNHRLSFFGDPKLKATQYHIEDAKKLPSLIEISRLNVNAAVAEAKIVDNQWEIIDGKASHLVSSARPDEKGSIIIYAHNSRRLFGPLISSRVGDVINVTTRGGKIYSYRVIEKDFVSPTQVDMLTANHGETLVLYTCAGFADTQRLILKARPL